MKHEEEHPHEGDWLGEIVFGLNDGLVTTLVFILLVHSLARTHLVTVILGEILAGAIAMTLGGYLSARTAKQILAQRRQTELYEIRNEPEEEREELRDIYRAKGLDGELLEDVVQALTANEERWLQAMMHDEHGVVTTEDREITSGLLIGLAFIIGGLVPLFPFMTSYAHPVGGAIVMTLVTSCVLGYLKAKYTMQNVFQAAGEFLVLVGTGTVAGAVLGHFLG